MVYLQLTSTLGMKRVIGVFVEIHMANMEENLILSALTHVLLHQVRFVVLVGELLLKILAT